MAADKPRAKPWRALTEMRQNAGLQQTQLAKKLGCSQVWISQLERGFRLGRPDSLKPIADYFGLTVTALLATREPLDPADMKRVA